MAINFRVCIHKQYLLVEFTLHLWQNILLFHCILQQLFIFSFKFSQLFLFNAGFYFIPGAIIVEEQCHWIRESLTSFPQPPNRTNHNAIYGPITDLFVAFRERKVLVEEDISCANEESASSSFVSSFNGHRWTFCEETGTLSRGNRSKSIPASVLLRKLRWSTLGLQFDWSKVIPNFSSSSQF